MNRKLKINRSFLSLPQIRTPFRILWYYDAIVRVDGSKANKEGHLGV